MPRGLHLSVTEQSKILAFKDAGFNIAEIAQKIERQKIINHLPFQQSRIPYQNSPGSLKALTIRLYRPSDVLESTISSVVDLTP
ncbi:hypothetical protein NPIL_299191 [Nephila pilipes]|uniref:Tc3 transposase DNA binding domain-containing protein n=1 Tax=Nephila pilipes TaxID=299642 RepID=A0A8X6MNM8_NEPPI|nr:hypothetical protein NPIL_299191 [Nephila pilipes]